MASRESVGDKSFTSPVGDVLTPNTYDESCADKYLVIWRQVRDKAFHGLTDAGTSGATQQPHGVKVIPPKWTFNCKSNEHVNVVWATAGLVARGYKQRDGTAFFETIAPTPVASCFRLLGAVVCVLGFELCHFDAEQAFVQSTLEEDVFM